jgi:alkanesulfonate monooxygenase SsuD/methylene tetrahydromethanopterin reductase-like flavin-dependent oxidoreductase (luciferase family)
MNTLAFGIFITPQSANLKALRDKVHAAEDGGFDFVAIQDHPYVPGFLDMMSSIGILLGETSRIHFLSDVANLPLRPPAVLAKAAATLSLLSGGRFELGVGGGGNWPGIVSLGGRALTPKEAVEAFEEAITIILGMWGEGRVLTFAGEYYQLEDASSGPPLEHRPQLWFGARGPRMCALTGRLADGWIAPISTPYEAKPRSQQQIDEAARAAGRDPSEVRRMMQLVGSITDSPQTMQRPRSGPGSQPIRTTPHVWVQIITELISEERFDSFNFVLEQESVEQIRRFATEVVPVVRALEGSKQFTARTSQERTSAETRSL